MKNYHLTYNSKRLTLETLTPENMSENYIDWLKAPEILKYLEIRHTGQTKESILKYVESMLLSENNLLMGIFLKENKKHIGNIKLGPVNALYKRADIGIIIGDKNAWGKGYATEAIESLCNIASKDIGLKRVHAGAYASNKGSVKAFLKAGFKQEGLLKDHWSLGEQNEDGILMGRVF